MYDLGGLAVSSVPVYIPRLQSQYGIIASDANITGIETAVATAELVAQGNLAAFLYDDAVAEYVAGTFPGCSVRVLPDGIQPFDYGMAFKKGTDPQLVANVSRAILNVQEQGLVTDFEDRFLLLSSPCSSANDGADSARISFDSVYGLWVILAAGLVAGLMIMVAVRIRRIKAWKAHKEAINGLPRGVAPEKSAELNGFTAQPKKSALERMTTNLIDTDEYVVASSS